MIVAFMTSLLTAMVTMGMVVPTEEPHNSDERAAEENEQHLDELILASLVEFCDNDLTAGHIDERATRNALQCDINE